MCSQEKMRLLRRAEVEEQFGIPVRFLELAVSRGNGPAIVRLGRSVRYRVCDILDWIEQQVEGCR
jgi:predicted DNA-binding transcriptional regulator AlpA